MRLLILLSLVASLSADVENKPPINRKVLLIGADGLLPSALKASLKTFQDEKRRSSFVKIFTEGIVDYRLYAGGKPGKTEQPTTSGPGWATILSGVWANEHKVYSDSDVNNMDSPTIFNYIGTVYPKAFTAVASNWWKLQSLVKSRANSQYPKIPDKTLMTTVNGEKVYQILNSEPNVVEKGFDVVAAKSLFEGNTKFLLVYFSALKAMGAESGFSSENPEYMSEIDNFAGRVEQLLEHVNQQRQEEHNVQWLVAIVSSHGGHDKEYGSQSEEDRTVFAAFHDPKDERYSSGREAHSKRGLDVIAPTLLDYLFGEEEDGAGRVFKPGRSHFRLLGSPLEIPAASVNSALNIASSLVMIISTTLLQL